MKFLGFIGDIFSWNSWMWLYRNPIVIVYSFLYFIPYFFIISMNDFIRSIGVPDQHIGTVMIFGIIIWTVIYIVGVVKLLFYLEEKKHRN
jgi:hypothetical protein